MNLYFPGVIRDLRAHLEYQGVQNTEDMEFEDLVKEFLS